MIEGTTVSPPQRWRSIGAWLRRRAENILAAMLGTMFFAFIGTIVLRYVFNMPTGWLNELSVIMWLYLVPFGAAFVVTEKEEIRLDLIYSASPADIRRLMGIVSAVSLVALFTVSFPAVLDYVLFMRVQRTAYLKIRFDWLYSIYAFFAVAVIVRQLWLGYQAIWGKTEGPIDVTNIKSGV